MNHAIKMLLMVSPFIVNVFLIIKYIRSSDLFYLRFFYILLGSGFMNHVLKEFVFKPLMGNKKYPILGIGTRPTGATNCGLFYDKHNTISKSYGMPSGHTQFAAVFSTISILKVLETSQPYHMKVFECIILILFIVSVAQSRILLKCHTLQQTLVGGLIGIFIGYKSYKYT